MLFFLADSDIKLNTPRADFGGSVPFVSVTMSLIPDNIAQEMNETFAITIAPGNAAATQVLSSYTIQSRINGTSIDSDSEYTHTWQNTRSRFPPTFSDLVSRLSEKLHERTSHFNI